MIATTLFAALLAQATPHITPAAIDTILAPAAGINDPRLRQVPAGLPLSAALFAGKPLWAVLIMCSEHRAGAGLPPGAPVPQLTPVLEKNRVMYFQMAAKEFSRQFPGEAPEESNIPVGGWGSEFIKGMNAAAAKGQWSAVEFEDACRLIGMHALRPGT